MSTRIEDYAMIGDTRTAALVGCDGSIDWLCVPRFDSPACFAALLGDSQNGRWLISPKAGVKCSKRSYRNNTLILETTFETEDGAATVIDFMPLERDANRIDVVRIVRGDRGHVDMKMELTLRFDYGMFVPWVRRSTTGLTAVAGPNAIELRTPVELEGREFHTFAEFSVRRGQRIPFVLTWHPSHLPAPRGSNAQRLLSATEKWWESWSRDCTYGGEDKELVQRSLIVLKALQYRPTGGIVAAPTTSLPESIGGIRNWDYRYCWLRDATFTLYALQISGYAKEAQEWQNWLLRAVAGKPSDLQIMYGVTGDRLLPEMELPWLKGYEDSRPVRIGNAAYQQFQLDVYGEIMDSIHVGAASGGEPSADVRGLQKEIIAFVERAWTRPDEGLWEVRGPRRHFTHSKMMAWVAVDRAIKAAEKFNFKAPLDDWRRLRLEIHAEVCDRGFDVEKNSFVQFFGGQALDASLLMMPLVGFLPASDPRVVGTVDAVQRELSNQGFLHRYTVETGIDGLPGDDGTFLICSFWLADNLQLIGRKKEAAELFNKLTGVANDVGLLAEEYDPVAKRMLGNFPQAISHVGLVNTAHNLHRPARGPALQRPQGTTDEADKPDKSQKTDA